MGKKVLVTGGTRGIGKAAAQAFLSEGAQVVISGSREQSIKVAMQELTGSNISGVAGDVSVVAECERMVQFAATTMQGLDILVNSAGVYQHSPIAETDEEVWNRIMDINVRGSYFCSRAALPFLRQSGDSDDASAHGLSAGYESGSGSRSGSRSGSIVHLGSESGINGYAGSTAYCASKGAMVNLTRSMAMELAPAIRVNIVCPGVVDTDMAREGFAIDGDQEKGMQQQRSSYPLKRVATAGEVASAILYLSSDDARFITGESLVMDGGATVGK